ncbi:MAG: sulfatase-like hydrolase/transferase [Lachnospiraceae bacterium]|nr:sulfatase-like hydrolase/transferase [Lachnospiraceae bacterium]
MKQNVVFFFTDQQRFDSTGMGHNPCGLTPNFDRMAMNGTFARRAFTPQPVCGPARAVLQTGMYATSTGNYHNGVVLTRDHKTMADYFNEAGYFTGYIGKWHLSDGRHAVPVENRGGYQWWLGANSLEHTSTAYHTLVYDNENQPVELPGYRVDALTDAAIRFINDRKGKEEPFFLFLSFLEPHFQNCFDDFPAPDAYRHMPAGYMPPDLGALTGTAWEHLGGYYGMIKRLDEALGRIQDALKSLGMDQNTILAYSTDHGCHFKTRNKEYKRSCHESSIRIPLAFTGGPFTGGGTLNEKVSLVDVAPTLLDACGIPVPEDMQGRSIMPYVRHEKQEPSGRDIFIQISESQVGRAIRTDRWKYSVEAPDKHPIHDSGSEEYTETFLYDLEHDPYELHNLIHSEAHAPVCRVLAEKLKACMAQAGETIPVIHPAEKKRMGQLMVFKGEENL